MTAEDRLVDAVESFRVEPGSFDHPAHVRLAFAYLRRHDLFEALARCRRALSELARHLGADGKYHETVTCALVFLIHERMEAMGPVGWEAFAAANPDLLRWKDGAFFDYYPDAVLGSELARRTFVLPHADGRAEGTAATGAGSEARAGEVASAEVASAAERTR